MPEFKTVLRVLNHPTDTYEELKYYRKWNMASAFIILFLWFVAEIFQQQITDFKFNYNNKLEFNILYVFARTFVLFAVWTVINWAVTTLLDGKGTTREIFVSCSYALVPYVFAIFLCVFFSRFLILEEGVFLTIIQSAGTLYSVCMLISALRVIHDYSVPKTIASILFTVFGIVILLFLIVLFYGLVQKVVLFFQTIYVELMLRQ